MVTLVLPEIVSATGKRRKIVGGSMEAHKHYHRQPPLLSATAQLAGKKAKLASPECAFGLRMQEAFLDISREEEWQVLSI
jgi:hypothetical protein